MDIASLVVGIPSLFTLCMEVLGRYDAYKSFSDEAQAYIAQFEADKLRLELWGENVGIVGQVLSEIHNPLLDHKKIGETVMKILKLAVKMFETTKETMNKLPQSFHLSSSMNPITGSNSAAITASGVSRRAAITWASTRRKKFLNQVATFNMIVERLHDIVPPQNNQDQNLALADLEPGLSRLTGTS